jgi:choline dehydrogenase
VQSTTRQGKRSSTYQAYLQGEPERRPDLRIITNAQATRVILEPLGEKVLATGIEYRTSSGDIEIAQADKEVKKSY